MQFSIALALIRLLPPTPPNSVALGSVCPKGSIAVSRRLCWGLLFLSAFISCKEKCAILAALSRLLLYSGQQTARACHIAAATAGCNAPSQCELIVIQPLFNLTLSIPCTPIHSETQTKTETKYKRMTTHDTSLETPNLSNKCTPASM
jgi:hypothetical protein